MLDGGPSRVPQPIDDRRAGQRPAQPVRRTYPEPQGSETEPKATHRPPAERANAGQPKAPNRFSKPLIIAAVAIGLLIAGWLAWSSTQNSDQIIDSDKYQAVFLTNGNTFFGKLTIASDDHLKLSQVFYPEAGTGELDADSQQPASVDENTTRLIPFKEHMYGPEDEMIIDRQQMVFFMNLKSDGQVSKLIAEYQSND